MVTLPLLKTIVIYLFSNKYSPLTRHHLRWPLVISHYLLRRKRKRAEVISWPHPVSPRKKKHNCHVDHRSRDLETKCVHNLFFPHFYVQVKLISHVMLLPVSWLVSWFSGQLIGFSLLLAHHRSCRQSSVFSRTTRRKSSSNCTLQKNVYYYAVSSLRKKYSFHVWWAWLHQLLFILNMARDTQHLRWLEW